MSRLTRNDETDIGMIETDEVGSQIRFSNAEMSVLARIIFTVEHQFDTLAPAIFSLDEDTVADFADKFLQVGELVDKPDAASTGQ